MANEYSTVGTPSVRWHSTVERARYRGKSVYIKRFGRPSAAEGAGTSDALRLRCKREIDIIRHLPTIAGLNGSLGVLTLAEGRQDDATLVTYEVPGRPLLDAIATGGAHADRERAIFLAGRWIRLFQTLSPTALDSARLGSSSPLDLVVYCDIRLDRIQREGYGWLTPPRRQRVIQALTALSDATPDDDRRLVWSHGDYAPNNVVWDGRVLTPIDFAMANLDRPLKDVTYFIHRLEMMRIYAPYRSWPIEAWRRAFLEGYERPNAETSPLYQALVIRHLLCRLNTYVTRPPRNGIQRAHDAWVRRRVRSQLMRLAERALDTGRTA